MPTVPTLKGWIRSKAFPRTLIAITIKVVIHYGFVCIFECLARFFGCNTVYCKIIYPRMSGILFAWTGLHISTFVYPMEGGLSTENPPYYADMVGMAPLNAYEVLPTCIVMASLLDETFTVYTMCFNCGCVIVYCLCAYYMILQRSIPRQNCHECFRCAPVNEYKNRCPSCIWNICSLECLQHHNCRNLRSHTNENSLN